MPTELKNANAFRKALKQFSPDLDNELRGELVGFLKPLVKKARGFLPSNSKNLTIELTALETHVMSPVK